MFRFLRRLGGAALWIGAGLGVIAGTVWLATAAGLIQPLIVISGSMEPAIGTGDLLIATKVDTDDLMVGDIVSLPSDLTSKLVTHRIVSIEPIGNDRWQIEMRGDANTTNDIAPYIVGDEVWKPGPRLPGVGYTVSTLMQRGVVVPALLALLALLGLSLIDGDDDDDENHGDHHGNSGGNHGGDRSNDRFVGSTPSGDDTLATITAPWPPPRILETASR
jgi:signal peptidase